MNKVQQIRAEIERRFNDNIDAAMRFSKESEPHQLFVSAAKEDMDILSFIDSLTEQTEEIPPKFPLISPKDSNIGENGKNLQKSASKELEKEIDTEVLKLHTAPFYDELANFAIHFVNWQKEKDVQDFMEKTEKFLSSNIVMDEVGDDDSLEWVVMFDDEEDMIKQFKQYMNE